MRWATIRTETGTHAARVDGDTLVELDARDVGELLARGGASETGTTHDVDTADYAPLVTHPGKILCQGLNYRSHILEMGHELPEHPTLFAKFREALIGAHDDIFLPRESDAVDWEAELALVIGTPVRRASSTEAAAAIAGFTVANDISMRDWQYRTLEWLQGKTWEHATPVGPWLVTPDELGGAAPDLAIGCEVDGVVRQASRTSELVFSPADLVAYASRFVTLEPGDLLLTGTPAGVGHGMVPPRYLRPDEVVVTTIEGLGQLRNRCVLEPR
jgi:acylpyruvate hydrolase